MRKQSTIAIFILLTLASIVGLYILFGILLMDSHYTKLEPLYWIVDALKTEKKLSQLSDSLSIILGIPTALLGTLFAIIIAEKAYTLSKETKDISIRSENIQKRQDKLEIYQFIDGRIHHCINNYLELDNILRSLNYTGVILNNFHHLDFKDPSRIDKSYLDGSKPFPPLKALEFKFQQLSEILLKIENDPLSRIIFYKSYKPNHLLIRDPYFKGREYQEIYSYPLSSLLSVLNSGYAPSLSDMPSDRIGLGGRGSCNREHYGIHFVGWFLPITRKTSKRVESREIECFRVNHYGILLSQIWECIPSLKIIKAEFLSYYDMSLMEIEESVIDKYFDNIKYDLFLHPSNTDIMAIKLNKAIKFYNEILRVGSTPKEYNVDPEISSAKALYLSKE